VSATPSLGDRVACSTCHREHHGAEFDLTAIDNAACQACHRAQYAGFADDHPDFGNWPYERRTRIAFNHASHSAKYFPENKHSFDCRSCHMEDATRAVQLTASYEAACASCHDEKIATSTAQGVPVFVVPMLDLDALRSAGHDIGNWPEQATGDFDGRLPATMKLLLSADGAATQAMHTLGHDFEFADVDPDNPLHLAACAALAAEIKELFAELVSSQESALRDRLTKVLGRKVPDAELEALAAGLSADTLRGAGAWMSSDPLLSAAATGEKGSAFSVQSRTSAATNRSAEPRTLNPEPPLNPEPSYAPAGAWFLDDTTLSIRYRPAAHADPVLTSWLDLLRSAPDLAETPIAMAAFKKLSHPTAAGLCMSCHSVEQTTTGQLAIHWRAHDRAASVRSFTKFSHAPHVLLPQLADCNACHAIDARATRPTPSTGWDARQFASEFLPISKQTCVTCHTATAAGDACQQCHNYHVELPSKEFTADPADGFARFQRK
jgi:hypothetical protein